MSFVLPVKFGYVAGVVATSVLLHHGYMSFKVGAARKKYGVKYPDLYATKDNCPNEQSRVLFNCTQRGHQNSLENLPSFYAMLLVAGLQHPITASIAGLVYVLGKALYFQGYSSGNPEARYRGAISYLGTFTLLGICIKMAVSLLSAA